MRISARVSSALWLLLCLPSCAALAQSYEVYHSFVYPAGSPHGPVLKAPDGTLYGTAETGGVFGKGSVYSLTPDGAGGFTFATLHSFVGPDGAAPRSALVFGPDGNLYGTTSGGGATGAGTLFRIAPSSGRVTRIHDFADGGGTEPTEVVFASDGALWGTTKSGGAHGGGTAYRLGAGDVFSVVHDFDGSIEGTAPVGGLLPLGVLLYGTASGGGSGGSGTVFRMDLTGGVTTIHTFTGTDGSAPLAALIPGTDGNLYGSTSQGGSAGGFGTIFRMDSAGGVTTLHNFNFTDGSAPWGPLLQTSDGQLFGTTAAGGGSPLTPAGGPPAPAGTVFRIDTLGTLHVLDAFVDQVLSADSGGPIAGLVDGGDGFFYGTTWNPFGTIYRIDPSGVLPLNYVHLFGSDQGPILPNGLLADLGGKIYGTTLDIFLDSGTIYRLDAGFATVLHVFVGSDGGSPNGLLTASDGALYGTTGGGGNGAGTIFRFTPPETLETLYAFSATGPDGDAPEAGLVEYPNGDLYGTTEAGGTGDFGTAFHITTAGAFESLHSFDGADGQAPRSPLVPTGDGAFYGTTPFGGSVGWGNIYSIDTLGSVSDVHDFTPGGTDGTGPDGGLVHATDGNFYGATTNGGANNKGVLFRLDGTGTVTPLHDFTASEASYPAGTLVQASDARLYGISVYGGVQGFGTFFSADTLGNVSVPHTFSGPDGSQPNPGLLVASDGAIYGTTFNGGLGGNVGGGVVFRWWLSAVSLAAAAISPTSGPASGGTPVVVTGDHLSTITGVTIGGVAATPPFEPDQGRAFSVSPALAPGTLDDVTVQGPGGSPARPAQTLAAAWFADFTDVDQDDIFHSYVETIFRAGITAGCGGGAYCRDAAVRRDQMAVFLLKAEHGTGYAPPACAGVFPDVPCPGPFTDWVEELAAEGVTAGCGGGDYCPAEAVTRAQMAVFLLKTKEGSSYVPPPPVGIFNDVPTTDPFAPWIEDLANRHITGGCQASPPLYCPANPNTRGQMAVFLTKTFGLQ